MKAHQALSESANLISPESIAIFNRSHDQRCGPPPYCAKLLHTQSFKEFAPPGFDKSLPDYELDRMIWNWHTLRRESTPQSMTF